MLDPNEIITRYGRLITTASRRAVWWDREDGGEADDCAQVIRLLIANRLHKYDPARSTLSAKNSLDAFISMVVSQGISKYMLHRETMRRRFQRRTFSDELPLPDRGNLGHGALIERAVAELAENPEKYFSPRQAELFRLYWAEKDPKVTDRTLSARLGMDGRTGSVMFSKMMRRIRLLDLEELAAARGAA